MVLPPRFPVTRVTTMCVLCHSFPTNQRATKVEWTEWFDSIGLKWAKELFLAVGLVFKMQKWRFATMLKNSTPRIAVLVSALFLSTATLAMAQQTEKTIKKGPITVTSAASGEEMFNTYCAVCHGTGGKGDGPAASEFKKPPANLTLLTQQHDGKYPSLYVTQVIETGPRNAKAHGSKDMPVWGALFEAIGDHEVTKLRIHNLNTYVETLQAK